MENMCRRLFVTASQPMILASLSRYITIASLLSHRFRMARMVRMVPVRFSSSISEMSGNVEVVL